MSTNLQFQFSLKFLLQGHRQQTGLFVEVIFFEPGNIHGINLQIFGHFQLEGKDSSPLDIIIELRCDFDFVFTEIAVRLLRNEDSGFEGLHTDLQRCRRIEKAIVDSSGPADVLWDTIGFAAGHSLKLRDGECHGLTRIDGDLAAFPDDVQGMNSVRCGIGKSQDLKWLFGNFFFSMYFDLRVVL